MSIIITLFVLYQRKVRKSVPLVVDLKRRDADDKAIITAQILFSARLPPLNIIIDRTSKIIISKNMSRHNNNNNNMIVQKNEKDCRNIYERTIFVTTTIYLGITGLNVRTPRYKNVSENRSDYKSNRAPRRECFLLHPPPSPSAASLTCTPGAAGRLRTPSPSRMTFFSFRFLFYFLCTRSLIYSGVAYLYIFRRRRRRQTILYIVIYGRRRRGSRDGRS